MIETIFQGRLGNNLYQYAYSRILAEKSGYALSFVRKSRHFSPFGSSQGIVGFPKATPLVGISNKKPITTYVERFDKPLHPDDIVVNGKVKLDGWFQFTDYFTDYFDSIRAWLQIDPNSAGFDVSSKDLLLNLRLGEDYNNEKRCWVIDNSFYLNILDNFAYDKLYICTDNPCSSLLDDYKEYSPTIFSSGDALTDFKFVKSFKKIAISTSTFSWWAAFLSDAEQIFFPDTTNVPENCWNQGKHFVKEDRYIVLEAKGLQND